MVNLHKWLEFAQKNGAQEVELFYEHTSNNNIKVYQQNVESLTSATAKGLGVRTFVNNGMGFAYTSNLEPDAIEMIIKESIENAKICPHDEYNGLPEKQAYNPIPNIYNEQYSQIEPSKKIELLLQMEDQASKYQHEISKVVQTSFADQVTEITLLNSNGFQGNFKSNYCYSGLYVAAERNGEMQTGGGVTYGRHINELMINRAIEDACDTAIVLLGGKKVKSQKAPIVFDKKVGMMFLYVLSNSLYAESVQKGRSLFKDKLNKMVASPDVSIVDDGLYAEGLATSPFDGEGVPSNSTQLVEKGILKAYMYDTYTAKKDGVKSTGNASRSYRSTPSLSTTNFYMKNGKFSKDDIIKSVKNGFYVMEVSGLVTGGANPINGDFSVGATGRWIVDGEFTTAVREVTIAGNLMTMMENIELVGNDMEIIPMMGSYGSPTFKVNELTISGT
ncbi:TldD/PmbA family protein [Desulfuribacillus alkaliarsenatis]|uniref:Peptidase U62 n=1 Tax=Desulfuribacillus alkaliarsenatis TaxID=766136 RepID=A0A1E5G662_9FIRM|nr:TldD/PmbA family protein [Desulfuribacillus alkaliarsenatis]OEF98697.1 peptidase U62 [Desulfuribacillus alkaliarsenatis]